MLPIIRKAAKIVGNGKPHYTKLADLIGCQRPSLYVWRKVPVAYMRKIAQVTDNQITVEMLRPDIFKE